MRILLAADGSKFTKKALAFLVTHEGLSSSGDELVVLHVHMPVPPRVKAMLGNTAVQAYHEEESEKVLEPIRKFLAKHNIPFKCVWCIGPISAQIVKTAEAEKSHLIVMGTHGHGFLGRVVMGSVAQRVLTDSTIPVLLVK